MRTKNEKAKDKKTLQELMEEKLDTPILPDRVVAKLPEILREGAVQFISKRERDIFTLGSIALISGALPNVYGYYDKRKVFAQLYLMITAPPSSGKGVLNFARNYTWKIEEDFRNRYQEELKEYRTSMREKENEELLKPVLQRLILPANSSSASFMRDLKNANGSGIIFETEADTLSVTLGKEWGNYSDLLRKAFHHEEVNSSRLAAEGNIDICEPKLALVLSGTYDQVGRMKLDDPTNGLQSRFLFYIFETLPNFKDVSPFGTDKTAYDFKELGERFYNTYSFLRLYSNEFKMTERQWKLFHHWWGKKMNSMVKNHNIYATPLISRLALSSYRILMILSVLRGFESKLPAGTIACSDEDIILCKDLMECLIYHSFSVFSLSAHYNRDEILGRNMQLFECLPMDREFSRKEALAIASSFFPERSLDRALSKLVKDGLLFSPSWGKYLKRKK